MVSRHNFSFSTRIARKSSVLLSPMLLSIIGVFALLGSGQSTLESLQDVTTAFKCDFL